MPRTLTLVFASLLLASTLSACAAGRLIGYQIAPDYPEVDDADSYTLSGLTAPVRISYTNDGIPRIEAQHEADLFFAEGFLQARDRLFQLDFLRHMARGRLAELVGNVPMGGKSALDLDRMNRFLGFEADARRIYEQLDPAERANLDAFAAGVNAWIALDQRSLEHRLLDTEIALWHATDTMAVFRIVMFGLTHNYSREVRRLLIACDTGFDALERVWPTRIDFPEYYLPEDAWGAGGHAVPDAVAPELRTELADLCPKSSPEGTQAQGHPRGELALYNPLQLWEGGIQSSNNWVVSGKHTSTGKPFLANDPHMPHLNPPIVWPVHQKLPSGETVGFVLVGTHRVFVGHNFHVAWGSTINNVDLQDLYVEKPMTRDGVEGYEYEGAFVPFEIRTEEFRTKDGEVVSQTVRATRHGVLLNDIEPFLASRIPLTALRTVALDSAGDSVALQRAGMARTVTEYVDAMQPFDTACINWVVADTAGNIGWTSPCRVPKRPASLGTFPVPGWLSAYEWQGIYEKSELPRSINPEQGWIATANNQPIPRGRFPTPYDNDSSPPNRWARIAGYLSSRESPVTMDDMTALQMDVGIAYWPKVRADLESALCASGRDGMDEAERAAADLFCAWDGRVSADSPAASLFMLFSNHILDVALADDLTGGADGETWNFVQSVAHIETNAERLWYEAGDAAVWDDTRTPAVETRDDAYRSAFRLALVDLRARRGDDSADWAWGDVRPFVLKHFFGMGGGLLGSVFNADPLRGAGAPETVFKNQYLRSDRTEMHPMAGPSVRLVVDLGDPHRSRYTLAGGASGWPKSPHYADLLEAWMAGEFHTLVPGADAMAGGFDLLPGGEPDPVAAR